MTGAVVKAELKLVVHNPDVLTCIANLSNDEVFTPPELANRMLDTLEAAWAESHAGASIWADPDVTFLDPFTKSGVFLREITRRLTDGLEQRIPDLAERVDHILTEQVFGIGITQLTALLARRSLYCSKYANGPHSIARSFDQPDGNIWFERTEHTWAGGRVNHALLDAAGEPVVEGRRCRFCGASADEYRRSDQLETHAYAFIHTDDIRARIAELFGADMQFDVIIGNPPYQLADGGGEGASAIPLYHRFIEQAKALEPKQLMMVVPARWYSGGKGLDEFRDSMLGDGRLAEIHDFPETDLVFPGVNIRGGVCYFRWSEDHEGPARVTNHRKNGPSLTAVRPVREPGITTFIRFNEAISILNKVRAHGEPTYSSRVQSRNPFGIPSNFESYSKVKTAASPILLFRSRRGSSVDREVYVSAEQVVTNLAFKDRIKVLVSKASPGGDEYPHAVFSAPVLAPIGSVATETYLIVDFVDTMAEGANLIGYMRTRFFRFLVSLIKTTQNISKGSFAFVPVQDLTRPWSDAELYAKYDITPEEQAFIESMIRPMGAADA
ncbi:Eco57I restriction-modification methylase domain-containing protein [Agrococcus lahaulensis]|uniref:Eco57I restriction-modification methylase domain-containing protein n=1 Tax=Agrococcus lahaulensis TaxID=341722 RepID=UPI00042A5201|nr:Eco57I restriction-modification methylase domain-containing protein [Agrococcus lahaulensis]